MKAIIFFTRIPKPNFCKTRLYDFLSKEQACNLQSFLIKKNYEIIAKNEAEIFIFHTAGDVFLLHGLTSKDANFCLQNGESLGLKMKNAFLEIFAKNYKQILLIGSDLADLKLDFIELAFTKLKTHNSVIAPTFDGGYGILGFKDKICEVFDVKFSQNDVFVKTKNLLKNPYELPKIRDIDTKEDIFSYLVNAKIKLIGSGEYNANYLFNDRLFRVKFGSQLKDVKEPSKYEYDALKHLECSNVVPKVYKLYENSVFLPNGGLEMQFLKGRELDYKKDLLIAARLLSSVHNVKKSLNLIRANKPFLEIFNESKMMADIYFSYENADNFAKKSLKLFLEMAKNSGLDDELENECIINTELNNTNFIIGEKSYIIDWEKPILGECEQDLAHFCAPTTTNFRSDYILSEAEILSFLNEYQKQRNINLAKFNKYLKFNILRGICWCAMAKVEYENERKLGNVAEKLDIYLSSNFLSFLQKYMEKL